MSSYQFMILYLRDVISSIDDLIMHWTFFPNFLF